MIPWYQAALMVAAAALCTWLTRAIPFLLFRNKQEPPQIVRYLGKALPGAIMSILIIYCVRNAGFSAPPYGLPQLIAIAVVAALHLWKRNILLSIAGGTVLYMVLLHVIV